MLGAGLKAGLLNEPLAVFTQTGVNLGQSGSAEQENRDWAAENKAGRPHQRAFWSAVHRLRKMMTGSYRPREVAVEIHTPGGERREVKSARIGGRWRTQA